MKPEIMAPVGSLPALTAAIKAGADSVYFGVHQLNMRARASHNFTLEELEEMAKTCKKAGVRSYVTLNTLLYDHDLHLMRKIIKAAKRAGIDAVIVQDFAAIQYAQEVGIPIHASTQLSISNFEAMKFFAQYADTVVLAREVDLKMIEQICERIEKEKICGPSGELVKIEVFVHGALCIAQAGRCQMSLLQSNTSAQRGACLHECRKMYNVHDEETGHELRVKGPYIFSPKDLCTLPFLDRLVEAGISVFKIEGRGRTPDYVDTTVRVYREAVDAIDNGKFTKKNVTEWVKLLKSVYNRDFCDGYYLGKALPDWSGYSGNRSTDERLFVGKVNHYFTKAKIAEVEVQAQEFEEGDRLVFIGKTTGVLPVKVESIERDHQRIKKTERPDLVAIPVPDRVRLSDKVYLLKKRNLDEFD